VIKAVLFDFDGLLLDTETTEFHSFRQLYRSYGQDIGIEEWSGWAGAVGVREKACLRLEELLGKPLAREDAMQEQQRMYGELIAEQQLLPGVIDMLEDAKRLGLKIALASSATSEWAVGYIRQYGIDHYFDVFQTRDDVGRVKPDPEIYLRALDRLGVAGHEAIAFEDSPIGSQAATAAGIHCVVVPSVVTKGCIFDHAKLRLNCMLDMRLEQIIAAVTAVA